jgi:hypothetical protein
VNFTHIPKFEILGCDREGVPAAAVCEGNENLPSDSGRKAGPKFIVSSISDSYSWNWY